MLTRRCATVLVLGVTTYIAVKYRAFGAPAVYFGPFTSLQALYEWCDDNELSVSVITLVEPTTPIPIAVWS